MPLFETTASRISIFWFLKKNLMGDEVYDEDPDNRWAHRLGPLRTDGESAESAKCLILVNTPSWYWSSVPIVAPEARTKIRGQWTDCCLLTIIRSPRKSWRNRVNGSTGKTYEAGLNTTWKFEVVGEADEGTLSSAYSRWLILLFSFLLGDPISLVMPTRIRRSRPLTYYLRTTRKQPKLGSW